MIPFNEIPPVDQTIEPENRMVADRNLDVEGGDGEFIMFNGYR
jgi:hypothetical protein